MAISVHVTIVAGMTVAIHVRRLTGASIRRSLEFFIHALAGQQI